jgi:uncharacterized Tic20 family protein
MEEQQEPKTGGVDNKQERTWAMLCHLIALAGFIGIPLGNILGPLVVWLLKKEEFPAVDVNGKESLNFQISMTIYGFIAALLILVVVGIVLVIAIIIADVVLVIIATVKTNNGEEFRYPATIRFIK